MHRTLPALALAFVALGGSAQAATDPAATRVESFCRGILEAAKKAPGGPVETRAQHLRPIIEENFDVGAMARFAVGEAWPRWTAAEHAAVQGAMVRYTATRYARELDDPKETLCQVDPAVVTRGPDKLVRSKMTSGGDTTLVNYRLRQSGPAWKVIDVYYDGVSQLATQRADFAEVVRTKGANGLVAGLNELSARPR